VRKQTTLLVVEDHASTRALVRDYLRAAFPECSILEAENGARAREICADSRPQLVLMDVCLPDANGIELTQNLKMSGSDVTVIVISYLNGAAYRDAARAAGAIAYVVKDRLPAELIPTVAAALGIAPVDGKV
jgi:DNA-binding NarL/FixJ family response regulator